MTRNKNTSILDWQHLRPKVTAELFQEITHRIVEQFHPEKVTLFGSYAYGNPTPHKVESRRVEICK